MQGRVYSATCFQGTSGDTPQESMTYINSIVSPSSGAQTLSLCTLLDGLIWGGGSLVPKRMLLQQASIYPFATEELCANTNHVIQKKCADCDRMRDITGGGSGSPV